MLYNTVYNWKNKICENKNIIDSRGHGWSQQAKYHTMVFLGTTATPASLINTLSLLHYLIKWFSFFKISISAKICTQLCAFGIFAKLDCLVSTDSSAGFTTENLWSYIWMESWLIFSK